MFFKNLQYAFRNLWRDKFYTFLNGTGLAIGMAAALLIFLWANDELSYDDFHEQGDRIHKVIGKWVFAGEEEYLGSTPLPLTDAALKNVPEVEKMVRLWNKWNAVFMHSDRRFGSERVYFTDHDFFNMFDFPFVRGNAETAFSDPSNVVLTKALAERIYGTIDIVGQPLKMSDEMELTVSAVMEDVPSNSHIYFEALIPFKENYKQFLSKGATHWGAYNYITYAMLRPGVDASVVSEKLTALIPKKKNAGDQTGSFELQPLQDVYLSLIHI